MKELLIFNEDNSSNQSYAVYYTVNNRYYVIYTNMEKDENNSIILYIAKVLKEVNNTPEGTVQTGNYIGIDIADASELDNARVNIGEIISNIKDNTPVNVTYLPNSEINGIKIKGSRKFRLSESEVTAIIKKDVDEPKNNMVSSIASQIENIDLPVQNSNVVDIPVQPVVTPDNESNVTPVVESDNNISSIQNDDEEKVVNNSVEPELPTIAPNPFDFKPEPVQNDNLETEKELPVNPYEVLQQQRTEEMINNLANDKMQDIVSSSVIPVSELEKENEVKETNSFEQSTMDSSISTTETESHSRNSFVDSIVADVSGMLDEKEETSSVDKEEKEDYERLYNDALEKTIELEKELKELHNKLNNIKNIVE